MEGCCFQIGASERKKKINAYFENLSCVHTSDHMFELHLSEIFHENDIFLFFLTESEVFCFQIGPSKGKKKVKCDLRVCLVCVLQI